MLNTAGFVPPVSGSVEVSAATTVVFSATVWSAAVVMVGAVVLRLTLNTWAFMAVPLASPVAPPTPRLPSTHVTTKLPSGSAAIFGTDWSLAVAVLTSISAPTLAPDALNACALMLPVVLSALKSHHAIAKPPSVRAAMTAVF